MSNKKNSASVTIQSRLTDTDRKAFANMQIANINNIPTNSTRTIEQLKDLQLNEVQRDLDSVGYAGKIKKNGGFDVSFMRPISIVIWEGEKNTPENCVDSGHTISALVAKAEEGALPWDLEIPVVLYKLNKKKSAKLFAILNKNGIKPLSAEAVSVAEVGYGDLKAIEICQFMKTVGRTFAPIKSYLGDISHLTKIKTGKEITRSRLEKARSSYGDDAVVQTFKLLDRSFPDAKSDSMILLTALSCLFSKFPILGQQPEPADNFGTWFSNQVKQGHNFIKDRISDGGSDTYIAMRIVSQYIERLVNKADLSDMERTYVKILAGRYDEIMIDFKNNFSGKEHLVQAPMLDQFEPAID